MTTADPPFPLGEVESLHLELKDKDALERPARIAREAVAMLNAEGGDIWIGLREQGGAAVEIQSIENVAEACRRLHDHLVDTIEPSPTDAELQVEPVEGNGLAVLLVHTDQQEASRGPFALLEGARRTYVTRVGARIRPMSREEIASRFAANGADAPASNTALRQLETARTELLQMAGSLYWIHLEPPRDLEIDLDDPTLGDVLTDPATTDTPPTRFSLHTRFTPPQREGFALVAANGWLRIESNGSLDLRIPARELANAVGRSEINAFQILGYSISLLRIARLIYQPGLFEHDVVLAETGLTGAEDFTLRSSAWKRIGQAEQYSFCSGKDLIIPRPLRLPAHELLSTPDRCGLRLAAQIFEGYGVNQSRMPRVDWERGVVHWDDR